MHFDVRVLRHRWLRISAGAILLVSVGIFYKFSRQDKADSKEENVEGDVLSADRLKELKAKATMATSASIELFVKAPGVVDFHPKHALRIHPSFAGIVAKVFKNLGDPVVVGDTLALIESNVGLQDYAVTSPIKGTVLTKNVGAGQSVTLEDEIFSVGDASVLQARLAIAGRDVKQVKREQNVLLLAERRKPARAKIDFLSPILSEDSRTASAIIDIPGSELKPGIFVTGAIVVDRKEVAVSLPARFCVENVAESLVMVVGDVGITETVVKFGMRDYENCEVISGLSANEMVLPASDLALADTHAEHGKNEN